MRTARDLSLFLLAALLALSCTTDRTRRGYLLDSAPYLAPPQRSVIVIPGFGVTRLFDPETERYVWGTPRATVRTQYEDDLDLPVDGDMRDRLVPQGYVGSRGPVNTGWQLMEALRKFGGYTPDADLHPFYYDWRLSARDNASALGRRVEEISRGGKVDIVTHSAGAIVALTYVRLGGGADRVENLVMLAPPQRGVVDAFRIFVRPERFIRRSFPPEVVGTWPFVYELLPESGRFLVDESGDEIDFDAWSPESWARVAVKPDATALKRARELRDQLRSTPTPSGVRTTVLAGDCVPTTRNVLLRGDGTFAFYRDDLLPGEEGFRTQLFEPGDGTVPVSSAADGPDVQLFCDGHQGIAADPNVHRAILRALDRDR